MENLPLGLYWCSTPDHEEDWFVVAHDADEAVCFHEEVEGYERGVASAYLVCLLPSELHDQFVGWPDRQVLEACGAEVLATPMGQPRVVRLAEQLFVEGDETRNAPPEAARLQLN
jgi:hypothetical protein